jgi:hypothetical protein
MLDLAGALLGVAIGVGATRVGGAGRLATGILDGAVEKPLGDIGMAHSLPVWTIPTLQ